MRRGRFKKKAEEPDFFDPDEVERIEKAEAAEEPDDDESESTPDLRVFTPQEIEKLYQEHRDLIDGEAVYRMNLYRGSHLLVDYGDLVNEGFLGLLYAARKYDVSKGTSLRTYARYWIRKRIRQATQKARLNYQYLDYEIDGENRPWRTGVRMSEAEFTYEYDYFRTSAKLPVFNPNPERICIRRDKITRLWDVVNQRSERERSYMDYRFGFDGSDGHSWRKSREHFGLHGRRGEDLEFNLRSDIEQCLGYAFFDYALEYWMAHDSNKTDFKGERCVNTLENLERLKALRKAKKEKMTANKLTFHPMTEDEKRIISDWRYAEEYAIYNIPPYKESCAKQSGFAHPDFNGFSFYDTEQNLIGFTCLYPEEHEVMIGIGVAPEYCDRGYGQVMIRTTCRQAKKMFPGKPLYLEVRTWNARAIQCYNNSGFFIDGDSFIQTTSIGEAEFYRMVKK